MTARPEVLQQYVTAICATLGAMGIGLILGYASPAGVILTNPTADNSTITITEYENSWFSSTSNLGALIGCPLAGICINYFGRRGTIIYAAGPVVLGWILIVAAQNFPMLVIGRIISGTYCSFISISAPTYIGEYSSANIRGTLGSLFQLMVNVGILLAYCLGAAFSSFRWIAGVCALIPLVCSAFMFFKKESPMYLLAKGKEQEAEVALRYFRGQNYEGLPSEMEDMKESLEKTKKKKATLKDLLQPHVLKPFLISMSLFFNQQFSGGTAVLFNLSTIFKNAGSDLSENTSSIIIGIVQVVVVLISAYLVDRTGRRLLLGISAIFMAISHVALGTYFYLRTHNPSVAESITWLPLVSLIVFISAFSIGYAPIPWVMLGELFSPEIKELSSSIASMSNWTFAFIVTLLFQPLMGVMNDYGVYWMFAGFCIANFIMVITFVYETKGKTLQQINEHFGGPKISEEEENNIPVA